MPATIYETDILIIGAGAAGAAAAIEAGQAGVRVLVVAKGPMGKTGITPLGFTGYTAVTGLDPEDSAELHFRDTVVAGRYLSDQNLVEVMTAGGGDSARRLLQYGVKFQEENGALLLRQAPGMSRPRMLRIPAGGKHLIEVLKKEVASYPNVQLMPDLVVSDLLQSGRRVVGALALDMKTGQLLAIHARATILATGGKGQLWPYTDCPPESTGDGLFLAYRAGAELVDLEQELFYPTVVIYPEHVRGLEISYETFLQPGAKILNRHGEDIAPVGDVLPTRDQLANLIFREIKEGRASERGGVWIDLRAAPPSLKENVRTFLPAYKRLKHFGIEITEETLEVAPGAHTSLGGLRIDPDTRTSLAGLFAAGETTGSVHGANRLAGQAWLACITFGFRAGKSAALFVKENEAHPPDLNHVRMAEEELRAFLTRKNGRFRPYQVLQQIKSLMWEYIGCIRNAAMMKKGLVRLEAMREEVEADLKVDPTAGFNWEWAQALQVRSLLAVAEMLTRAALFREESRGTHFREDFPEPDDINWLAHTMIRKEGKQMMVSKIPVVLHRMHP